MSTSSTQLLPFNISEVVKGTSGQQLVEAPSRTTYEKPQIDHEAHQRKLKEHRRKMLNSIGIKGCA